MAPTLYRHTGDAELWLVNDGDTQLSLVLIDEADRAMPAAVVIPLMPDFPARANAAVRLWRLATGQPKPSPHKSVTLQQRRRLALTLRALDGHHEGEQYRAIAKGLFGRARVPTGSAWKTHDLRDRTIRLVRTGLALMRGGYRNLLRLPRRRNKR